MIFLDLNAKITDFLNKKGQRFTRQEWLNQCPTATESA